MLQESLENGYKADVSIHPDFRKELLALLSTYYEDLLDLKGASGVATTRPLALRRTPQKPSTGAAPADAHEPADAPAPADAHEPADAPAPAGAPAPAASPAKPNAKGCKGTK